MSTYPTWGRSGVWPYGRVFGKQQIANLNDAYIPSNEGPHIALSTKRTGLRQSADVEIVFTDLETALVREVEAAEVVIGCMAWLTNRAILHALSGRRAVSVLVQKEDFLRPDSPSWSQKSLHGLYARLPVGSRWNFGLKDYNYYSNSDEAAPVRCVGVSKDGPTVPRMHHKFFVFCRQDGSDDMTDADEWRGIIPYAVWTGSFNASENGTRSLENAVIIRSPEVAAAYLNEYSLIYGISEPLDWKSEWIQPEHRIGS